MKSVIVRMEDKLHADLKEEAWQKRLSLNSLIIVKLTKDPYFDEIDEDSIPEFET